MGVFPEEFSVGLSVNGTPSPLVIGNRLHCVCLPFPPQ
jgi:hypothetical protein